MLKIISSETHGEPGTGFEKRGNMGPFECGNCEYFTGSACRQKTMRERSREPKDNAGNIVVSAVDCCEYIERTGREAKTKIEPAHRGWLGRKTK